jgi:hypothetical protein
LRAALEDEKSKLCDIAVTRILTTGAAGSFASIAFSFGLGDGQNGFRASCFVLPMVKSRECIHAAGSKLNKIEISIHFPMLITTRSSALLPLQRASWNKRDHGA